MEQLAIHIPEGLDFSDLELSRDGLTGNVSFSWDVIDQISVASALPVEALRNVGMDILGQIINSWYLSHLSHGGAPNPVQEQLQAEAMAAEQYGVENVQRAPSVMQ